LEKRFDWPNDLIERINKVMSMPCSTPSEPEFKFKISEEAMQHNLAALEKYDFISGKALSTLSATHHWAQGWNFVRQKSYAQCLTITPCGIEWRTFSKTAANGR
jgi:hypothetical protein